ncbi:MAG: hypothetical protein OEY70_17900 [Acidimicrobiia bacterium]|nr:hypothetical protein [Acidimicrobiia bacterium]
MLNPESVFRGDAALTARQRQTVVFVGGIVAVLGAIVASFTGAISALVHRDDPVAMQAVAANATATTGPAEGSADAGSDLVTPDLGGAEADAGAGAPADRGSAPATAGGRFTGTYKPSKGGAPSPLAPTATTAPAAPTDNPGSTAAPTTPPPEATIVITADAGSSSTTAATSSTTTTRAATTTTRVTVTEATVPTIVITTPSTRPPTTAPPTTAPPTSSPVIPGPVA